MKTYIFLILSTLLYTNFSVAQGFTGKWKAEKKLEKGIASIEIEIANPVNEILYPAYIHIHYLRFKGTYEVLLAQRDSQTLAIGRDKISVKESPFSLGEMLVGLNGYLRKSGTSMDLQTISFPVYRYLNTPDVSNKALVEDLKNLIWEQNLHFVKSSEIFDTNIPTQKITNPTSSDYFFGIYRPKITKNGMISAKVYEAQNHINNNDTTSLVVNNEIIFDRKAAKDALLSGQINLKPGINHIMLFADNFGKLNSNTAILKIYTERNSFEYTLGNPANRWGTFLIAQLDLKNMPDEIPFANNTDPYSIEAKKRNNKLLGTIQIKKPEIKLEVWDAQQEDKDSVSIGLNNQWVQNGLEVKNKPKILKIDLKKGKNILLFMAQNLGLIPPNTAFVKLRFDNQERILEINTDLNKNNIIELHVSE